MQRAEIPGVEAPNADFHGTSSSFAILQASLRGEHTSTASSLWTEVPALQHRLDENQERLQQLQRERRIIQRQEEAIQEENEVIQQNITSLKFAREVIKERIARAQAVFKIDLTIAGASSPLQPASSTEEGRWPDFHESESSCQSTPTLAPESNSRQSKRPCQPPHRSSLDRAASELSAGNDTTQRWKRRRIDMDQDGGVPDRSNPWDAACYRSIDFDTLYLNGQATDKYQIVEYPKGSGHWFILFCKEHGLRFDGNPILAAVNHVAGNSHGYLGREMDVAVGELGTRVLDCNAAKAARNNTAFHEALARGYGGPRRELEGAAVQELSIAGEDSQSVRSRRNTFEGITNPRAGRVYLGLWGSTSPSKNSSWYAVLVLPTGNLGVAGMEGSISDTGLVNGHIPVCYKSEKGRILCWEEGYEDDGVQVTKRKFPVMWFEDDQEIPRRQGKFRIPSRDCFQWLPANKLRPFGTYSPHLSPVYGFDVAMSYYKTLVGMCDDQTTSGSESSPDETANSSMLSRQCELDLTTDSSLNMAPERDSYLVASLASQTSSNEGQVDVLGEADKCWRPTTHTRRQLVRTPSSDASWEPDQHLGGG